MKPYTYRHIGLSPAQEYRPECLAVYSCPGIDSYIDKDSDRLDNGINSIQN